MEKFGQIRKGYPKPESAGEHPKNLENKLRISFDEPNRELEANLVKFYEDIGLQIHKYQEGEYIVTEVPVTIPLETSLDYALQANLKLPVCRSDSNGEYWHFVRSGLKMLVSGGVVREEHTDPQGVTWKVGEKRNVVKNQAVIAYEKDGEHKEIIPKTKSTLSVLMPFVGFGEFEVVSQSAYDANRLKEQFDFILQMARKAQVDIIQVPVILKREVVEITKQWGGGAKRDDEWLLTLTIDKSWMKAQLAAMGAAWVN